MSRSYHNLVSRYNIYFNGIESLKTGEKKIELEVVDDYSRILPVYKASLPETENMVASNMDYTIEKCTKLIRLHSITAKPKRRKNRSEAYKALANREEYNNWVDNTYILSGKAYYYLKDYIKAANEFNFVLRKFPEYPEIYYEALTWLLRCYTELDMSEQAEEVIAEIEGSLKFPKKLNCDFDMASAAYYMSKARYADVITNLEQAITTCKNKANKARCHYILAQLYRLDNRNAMAISHYNELSKMHIPYPMRFSAKLSVLELSSNDNNINEIQAKLGKLLNSERNQAYQDQIYFALAQTELQAKNERNAIYYLQHAVDAFESNENQLIQSCRTLSDLYYKNEDYINSRLYYDTLFTVIDANYPDYTLLTERYKGLVNLSNNLIVIQREDSLQRLALMSSKERSSAIASLISKNNERNKAEELSQQAPLKLEPSKSLNNNLSKNSWYFYNPQTVAIGKQQFASNWGKRKLEDNWRRNNKDNAMSSEEITEIKAPVKEKETSDSRVTDNTDESFYLQDIPSTPEDWQKSNDLIADALFRAGKIFKYDLKNLNQSINAHEDLLYRYHENAYQLPVYFELWDSYTQLENKTKAEQYKQLILNQFSTSKYAKYLVNPNYFIEQEEQQKKIEEQFQQALALYQKGNYTAAAQVAKQTLAAQPDSTLIPNLTFIQLIGENRNKNKEEFGSSLSTFVSQFPNANASKLADNIRVLLQDDKLNNYQAMLESGYISENIKPDVEEVKQNEQFKTDANVIHYFVIVYNEQDSININRLKFDLANYNIDHYLKTDFETEISPINSKKTALLVKSFLDKEQSLIYLRSIIRTPKVFQQLRGKDYINFTISSDNYRLLREKNNLNEYINFYKKHYSQFTEGNFPAEELPSPEELMEQIEREKNAPKEKGRFVEINTSAEVKQPAKEEKEKAAEVRTEKQETEKFIKNAQSKHLLLVTIKDKQVDLRNTVREFKNFNASNFPDQKLEVNMQTLNDYQLILITGLADGEASMNYFRKAILNRNLFSGLGSINYRNFIISEENLSKITNQQLKIEDYTAFFREYYLSGEYKK